jgi:hypothetical protein
MARCWNGFCIAGDCDGVAHVDATGDTWEQRRGFSYNPATGIYDLSESETEPTDSPNSVDGDLPDGRPIGAKSAEGNYP